MSARGARRITQFGGKFEQALTNFVANGNAPAPTGGGVTVVTSTDVPSLYAPATIYKHTITGAANRGAFAISGLTAATLYRVSFYAFVPSSNTTTSVDLLYNNTGEGGTGSQSIVPLPGLPSYQYDMAQKGTWQRLVAIFTTGAAETSINLVIRGLLLGDVFYTTVYQAVAGVLAASYIPTSGAAVTRPATRWYWPRPLGLAA